MNTNIAIITGVVLGLLLAAAILLSGGSRQVTSMAETNAAARLEKLRVARDKIKSDLAATKGEDQKQ